MRPGKATNKVASAECGMRSAELWSYRIAEQFDNILK